MIGNPCDASDVESGIGVVVLMSRSQDHGTRTGLTHICQRRDLRMRPIQATESCGCWLPIGISFEAIACNVPLPCYEDLSSTALRASASSSSVGKLTIMRYSTLWAIRSASALRWNVFQAFEEVTHTWENSSNSTPSAPRLQRLRTFPSLPICQTLTFHRS